MVVPIRLAATTRVRDEREGAAIAVATAERPRATMTLPSNPGGIDPVIF
jgi:hypothetical protein